MHKTKIIFFFLLITVCFKMVAQVPFISSGKIVFEKKLNLEKEIEFKPWLFSVRDKLPKYQTTQHFLFFKEGKTLYQKGADIEEKNNYWGNDENASDLIYTDLKKGFFVKEQTLFEETILVSDSLRSQKWEMTNETREIAGFECHKATTIILDSIFVVAFYTDQITVSGGPMSYHNLPGMILGIAVPRMNLTVFATKVELSEQPIEKFTAPVAKKKIDYKGFNKLLEETTNKMYKPQRSRYVINALL